MRNKKDITKKIIPVLDAVAMNAAPEYWLMVKQAGLHLFFVCMAAKQFFIQH